MQPDVSANWPALPLPMASQHGFDVLAITRSVSSVIAAHATELDLMDAAIGDGDHGTNMKRGFDALAAAADTLCALPLADAVQSAGRILLMTMGGASGPLAATLLMAMGRAMETETPGAAFDAGTMALAARGRAQAGDKTVLDVLLPVATALHAGAAPDDVARVARDACEATRGLQARRGRAAFLGARSVGHVDPGARSAALLVSVWADAVAQRP
jgi:phosphoenolpyruvate---glycerone phosphotransferase subunit DhaL